jgi:four helix bundle protein
MGRNIKKYEVFKHAHSLVLKVYAITKQFPPEEKYGLSNQMRRSAYSIPMNLIEGGARNSEAEFRQFINIARGSCAEIQYQLELIRDLEYISIETFNEIHSKYDKIGKMLNVLSSRLKAKG